MPKVDHLLSEFPVGGATIWKANTSDTREQVQGAPASWTAPEDPGDSSGIPFQQVNGSPYNQRDMIQQKLSGDEMEYGA